MDTSKEYIKMCDCSEIQGGWHEQPITGDITNKGIVVEFTEYYSEDDSWELKVDESLRKSKDLIWLPRQDQLQEMVWKGEDITPWVKIGVLYNFLNWKSADREYDKEMKHFDYTHSVFLKTMEQLWLAFVMWELHQKKWDGKKWI